MYGKHDRSLVAISFLVGLRAARGFERNPRLPVLFWLLAFLFGSASGCSVRKYAINKLSDALAGSGRTFASDEDLELIREAVPFSLKLIESLLAETPRHRGLLLAAARGFAQYSYAFVQQDAEALEDRDTSAAEAMRTRARKLYLRARDYGLRGLEVGRPGFEGVLRKEPRTAVKRLSQQDVPWIYWTAVSWGAAISISKDDPEMVADLPLVEVMIDRALDLQEDFERGAIHDFLITYEMSRPGGSGAAAERARKHFERAIQLTDGLLASPLVSYAETVAVARQDRAGFQELLNRALAIDANARPEWRVSNLVMQRRAKWLFSRMDQLFAE